MLYRLGAMGVTKGSEISIATMFVKWTKYRGNKWAISQYKTI